MNDNDKYKLPKAGASDVLHAIVRLGFGAIPYVGATVSELFSFILGPPLQKRHNKWMEQVGDALCYLEKNSSIKLEDLQSNETFITVVLHASRIALRTHQKEKLEILRNAVVNSAIEKFSDDDTQQILLSLIDDFTPWHIRILKFFKEPSCGGVKLQTGDILIHLSSMKQGIETMYPELKGRYPFYNHLIQDLSSRGLIYLDVKDHSNKMATGGGISSAVITDIGKQFLEYIKSPF